MRRLALCIALGSVAWATACGTEAPTTGSDGGTDAGTALDAAAPDAGRDTTGLPYAVEVVEFAPGPNAGYGEGSLPGVVLGPPQGKGTGAGSLDVLSLGLGGHIVLGVGNVELIDGPGPDFVVFENAFWASDVPQDVFAELGEVAVSTDAVSWHTFACDPTRLGRHQWPGCAGWSPALVYDPFAVVPLDPALCGGDAFDLEDLGLESARYVRIRDLATDGAAPSAGFDLDAVGLVHTRPLAP